MTTATDSKPQPEPVVMKGKGGLSMSQQVLIALALGVTAGLGVTNLAHVARRWPNFRDWVLVVDDLDERILIATEH